MQILIETYTSKEANIIAESHDNWNNIYLSGRFLSGGIRNRNNRVYPLKEISKAVSDLNEVIAEHGMVVGELDHPKDRLQPELKYASHLITEIRMDGDHGNGKLKILDTPHGKVVKELIKAGFRPDVSSRGAGDVDDDGVVEGFMIQTIDIVSQASGIGCSPRPVYESIENSKVGYQALSLAEAVKHDESAQKYLIKEVKKFFDELRTK